MKRIGTYIILSLLVIMFSCEKEITLDLPSSSDKLVVEGVIEEGQFPYVILTKNASYFDKVDSSTIMNMIVFNAKVTVTDGTQTDSLQLAFDPFQLPYIKYVGSTIRGEVGKKYHLKIELDDRIYTASTTIPNPVQLDSIKFKFVDDQTDSLGLIWIYFFDPDTQGNYYRGYTKTLNKDFVFVHPYSSVSDDRLINGQPVTYTLNRGWDPNQGDQYFEDDNTTPWWAFVIGETVVVKFCSMDAGHFDFWYSVEQQMATDGNPFASPTSVRTNISGGALGVWGGYGVYLDTIKIEGDNISY
ncbi:MAG: DUF4249 domain-containing protein [Bacteroidota bacterium]